MRDSQDRRRCAPVLEDGGVECSCVVVVVVVVVE